MSLKMHFKMSAGCWVCHWPTWGFGFGATPMAAYDDVMRQFRSMQAALGIRA
jgi:hypothetical protein